MKSTQMRRRLNIEIHWAASFWCSTFKRKSRFRVRVSVTVRVRVSYRVIYSPCHLLCVASPVKKPTREAQGSADQSIN